VLLVAFALISFALLSVVNLLNLSMLHLKTFREGSNHCRIPKSYQPKARKLELSRWKSPSVGEIDHVAEHLIRLKDVISLYKLACRTLGLFPFLQLLPCIFEEESQRRGGRKRTGEGGEVLWCGKIPQTSRRRWEDHD
jgi:hypothetical protein